MSYHEHQRSFLDKHFGAVLALCVGSAILVLAIIIGVTEYDHNIDREQTYNELYSNYSCDKLIWEKQWEDKKVWKDSLELKILTKYLAEKRCGV